MKQQLIKIVFYALIGTLFSSCVVSSRDIILTQKINSNFLIGQDKYHSVNNGIWYLKYSSCPDTSTDWEGYNEHILIFKNPTDVENNKDFIIARNANKKDKPSYIIVKISNDKLVKFYPARNEKKYMRLRGKLNVPDSLNFK
jgi:hypothetical protein